MSSTNAGNVIATALANLNDGKNVQVDKVLHLRKTEVMDLVLDEILTILQARKETAKQLVCALKATLEREALDYVKEFTGLSTVSAASIGDGWGYDNKRKLRLGFYLKSVPVPSGRTLELGERHAYVYIDPSPALKARHAEIENALEEESKVSKRLYEIEHSKTKFKTTVIRSMLQEHKEGRSLLEGIQDLAAKLV